MQARLARRVRTASPRVSRAAPPPPSAPSSDCVARRPSRSRIAIASSCRPAALTARWRLADSALRTRLSSPRRARETWRASSSSSAPPAPIRRRNVPTDSRALPRHDAATAADAPRRRAGRGRAGERPGPAPRPSDTTNSRWVRPPARLSDPWARNRPRSQAERQWSAARSQSKPPMAGSSVVVRRRRTASRAAGPSRATASAPRPAASAARSQARAGSMPASSARRAATRSRSDRLTSRAATHGSATAAALALERPQDRVGQPRRVVVVGVGRIDDILEDRGAATGWTAGGQRRFTCSARQPVGVVAPNWLLAMTTSTRRGAVWAMSASTWAARSKPAVSPAWVATLQT